MIGTILGAIPGLIVGFIVNEINLTQPDKHADVVEHAAYGAIVGILIYTFLDWWYGNVGVILRATFGRVDYATGTYANKKVEQQILHARYWKKKKIFK